MLKNSAGFFAPGGWGVSSNPACNGGGNWYDVGNRSAAPHLLRSLLSCHRPGPHPVCIADRPLSRIYGTAERLQPLGQSEILRPLRTITNTALSLLLIQYGRDFQARLG